MQLEELLTKFETYGIRFDKKCKDLIVLGYEPNLGGRIIDDLGEIYDSIVNSTGISKQMRDYVKQLTDILATLTTDVSAKTKTKQQKQYDKVKERYSSMWGKKTKEIEQNDHLTEPVNEIVKDAKDSIEVISDVIAAQPSAKRYDRLRQNLPKCRALLEELDTVLDGVHDVSSKEAARLAAAVIDGLSNWAKDSLQFLTMQTKHVQELEKVVTTAKKWAAINQPGEKKNMATEKEIRTYNPNDSWFTVIKNVIHVTEQYEDLNVTYEEYCEGSAKLQETYDDISRQKSALEAKKQEYLVAFKNGKMNPVEAKQRVEETLRRIAALDKRAAEVSNRLSRSNRHREGISTIVSELRIILDQQLDEANGNPIVLSTILPYIPFEEIKAILVGNYTQAALDDLRSKYQIMKEQISRIEGDILTVGEEVSRPLEVDSLFGDEAVATNPQDAEDFLNSLIAAESGVATPTETTETPLMSEGGEGGMSELDFLFGTPKGD